MLNERLIKEATRLVVEYYEANQIMMTTDAVRKYVVMYYSNTEITDAETLAAVTLHMEHPNTLTYNKIQEIKEFYFPTMPIEYGNFHIGEIEEALNDELWWS